MMVFNRRDEDVMLSMESGLGGIYVLAIIIVFPVAMYQDSTITSLFPLDQVNDITITDFPDYVMRMTDEDEHNNSLLAQEYHVT